MLTQSRLKDVLHYNPDTGVFTWRVSRGRKAGAEAGTRRAEHCGKSYIQIQVDCKLYKAHRLAWLYTHGVFPSAQIDHEKGNGLDNRMVNLRDVTHSENSKNRRLQSNNASGSCGVCWNKARCKWAASISADSKRLHLGYFTDINDAIAVRKAAEIKYGYHPNHGESRPL